jgi:hypothetical protein
MTRASDLAKLLGAGATILDGTTISTADNTTQLTLTSTDADSSIGPVLDLVRDSASPADGDGIGQIKFIADNDAGEATTYSTAFTTLRDASNGAEDGQTINYVMTGGALVDHLRMGRGSANGQSEVVVNEGSVDIDFRVESNGNANMLFVDAGNDVVGIGTSSPNSSWSSANNLVISDTSSDGGMTILSGTSGNGNIMFADAQGSAFSDARGLITYLHASDALRFMTANAERMRITSTNVGINTSSPTSGYMLHVGGSSGVHTKVKIEATTATGQAELDLSADPAGVSYLNLGDENSYNIGYLGYFHSDNSMRFQTNSAERMRIDAGGSVLIGKSTPTDLHNTWNHLIIGEKGAIISENGGGGIDGISISDNSYIDSDTGAYAYQTTDEASIISQTGGNIIFSNAASGSAGAALSFSERMRIASSGYIYVNTGGAEPSASQVGVRITGEQGASFWNSANSGTGGYNHLNFYNGNGLVGQIYTNASGTVYGTSSDYRLKENVTTSWDATTRLKQLKPSRFNFIADGTDSVVDGFLAHEVASIVPEAITGEKDAVDSDGNIVPQSIDQSKLVPLLVKTIQELEARITALEGA